ncbi:MAG TPA: hypothetical protein VFL79_07835 [Terriglobia bacterium]|nr:hypothetical protein [Terriglobia bacterium]
MPSLLKFKVVLCQMAFAELLVLWKFSVRKILPAPKNVSPNQTMIGVAQVLVKLQHPLVFKDDRSVAGLLEKEVAGLKMRSGKRMSDGESGCRRALREKISPAAFQLW